MPPSLYLDNNATTRLDPTVALRMSELYAAAVANPASQHRPGRQALTLLEEAKTLILQQVGAPCHGMETANIVLTSGGTEANNLAIHSFSHARPGLVIVGAVEHPSILEAAKHRSLCNNPLRVLPVDRQGRYDLCQLADWIEGIYSGRDTLCQHVSLVSLMLGNNETGVLQDLQQVCSMCAAHGIPVHSDVIQAVGKIPVDMTNLGLTALTVTAHKLHGPVGVGALITLRDVALDPVMVGGGQQLGARAGTEPVIPTVAFAAALRLINEARQAGIYEQVTQYRDRFEQAMLGLGDTQVISQGAPRLPHTSNIAFGGIDRQALHMALDLAGLACSTGSACASGSSRPSGVLLAMGLPEEVVKNSLRFSFSRFTSDADVASAIEIVSGIVNKMRRRPGA